jgi:hypothetical protein
MPETRLLNVGFYRDCFRFELPESDLYIYCGSLGPRLWLPVREVQEPSGNQFVCFVGPYRRQIPKEFALFELLSIKIQAGILLPTHTLEKTTDSLPDLEENMRLFAAVLR